MKMRTLVTNTPDELTQQFHEANVVSLSQGCKNNNVPISCRTSNPAAAGQNLFTNKLKRDV